MRRLASILLLACAACATTSVRPPPERVAGCWISRTDLETRTMRWLPDANHTGALTGDMLVYGANGTTRNSHYTLEPHDGGWQLCAREEQVCRQVAEGQSGSLEGGRVFIDAYRENLRISIVGDGPERVIFRGRRDGCD